ncbi:hypothetical protein [Pseudomonas aeruginosa]|uniref:hypothetical protein n=1 Tax=Pseudomonas aeruginosa TaxID=287 RepID=UPI000FC3F5B3|nr:hypothetical protein [Pseudomonas aeruginosa]EKU6307974.1 hypothetical protein [Pseudomonas aeruginosa]EKX2969425.1 hypothetical protein [Pseudomonas aeruginosa]MBO8337154.1 hypothetical protein [Pseudomonas aeruginosa]RUE86390.1 hypothetical protein IPC1135_29945 [Pseudomonas aeruginosa]HBO6962793.1 hypothetical protein [Pseudomonas aeruginosa]
MATLTAATRAKHVRCVVGQTGVTDSEAIEALEEAQWSPDEAVASIRARFNEAFRRRLQQRQGCSSLAS